MSFLKKGKPRTNHKVVEMHAELKNGSKVVKFSMNIPRGLHEQFRRKSFLDNKDMKDVLIEAIQKYMKD